MILVDTSVWIEHLRRGVPKLAALLNDQGVVTHPFVIGELACGRLRQRGEILADLSRMPRATVASHDEALSLVETRGLDGTGVGWVDVHLLASALMEGCTLWTRDRRLRKVSEDLGVASS